MFFPDNRGTGSLDFELVEPDNSNLFSHFERFNTFGLDLETTGLNPLDSRILLCQIGFPDKVFIINVASSPLAHPLNQILPILNSHRWTKVIQNAKFEQKFFVYYYKTLIQNTFDTFLAELVLNPDDIRSGTANLASLSYKYTGIMLDKRVRETFFNMHGGDFSGEQLHYAAEDAFILLSIKDKQEVQLEEKGLMKIAKLEFDLAGTVAEMELTGVPINVPKWKDQISNFAQKHEEFRLRMHELLFDGTNVNEQLGMFERDAINLNSPLQVKKILKKLGLDVDTTNEREIALIDHPVARELLNYREYQKVLTSYSTSFLEKIHPFTGRLHADFQQLGTETGRFSCKEPNLQQMPEAFRECVSLENYKIVGADYSQIELRILAELSGDPKFIQAFNSGFDLHKSTASLMFGIPIESVNKEQRFIAKTINFGISYGMGILKLRDTVNAEAIKNGTRLITIPQAKTIMTKYKDTYKKVTEWLFTAQESSFVKGYSETIYGRKRFYNRPDINALPEDEYNNQVAAIKRKGANSPIQGTNADITKLAMLNISRDLRDYGYRANMIIQVHDEIVVLAHNRQAGDVKELIVDCMKRSALEILKVVPVVAEAYVSDIWKK